MPNPLRNIHFVESIGVDRGGRVWSVEATLGGSVGMPLRMTVLGFDDSAPGVTGLILVSPMDPQPQLLQWLHGLGHVRFIVVPNLHHTFWGQAMKDACPDACLVGPAGLAKAGSEASKDLAAACDVLVDSPSEAAVQLAQRGWPAEVDVDVVDGIPFLQEIVLLHRPSSTAVLTDVAFNYSEAGAAKLAWYLRAYLRWTGGIKPLTMTAPFRLFISDAAAAAASIQRILRTAACVSGPRRLGGRKRVATFGAGKWRVHQRIGSQEESITRVHHDCIGCGRGVGRRGGWHCHGCPGETWVG